MHKVMQIFQGDFITRSRKGHIHPFGSGQPLSMGAGAWGSWAPTGLARRPHTPRAPPAGPREAQALHRAPAAVSGAEHTFCAAAHTPRVGPPFPVLSAVQCQFPWPTTTFLESQQAQVLHAYALTTEPCAIFSTRMRSQSSHICQNI